MRLITAANPDHAAPALIGPDGEIVSWGALRDRVAATAASLGPRRRLVAIEARRDVETVIDYLGALSAGHVAAMLAPDDAQAWQAFISSFEPEAERRGGALRLFEPRAETELHPDLALLLSTSGSTGVCKSVRLSAGAVEANAASISSYLRLRPSDRAALILPLHYCYGLSVLHSHLWAGASVYLAGESAGDPRLADRLQEVGCTNFSGVPHSYRLLDEAGFRENPCRLRFMTVAGGALEPESVRAYREHMEAAGGEFFVMYGQTEATSRIAYMPPERLKGRENCIGVAVPGGALELQGEDGRPIAGAGEPGELVYRGPNVMMGYATARADLAKGPEAERLRTGDLAMREADGLFRIVGRISRMSKISGLRVSHDLLEQALARRGVEAAVFGDDRAICALHSSSSADEAVRAHLAEASGLPRLAIRVARAAELPRLAAGKLDREEAKTLFAAQEREARAGRQRQSVEEVFAAAFAPRAISASDSFASLGGDSLRYLQMALSLEELFGRLPEGWEKMSVAELERLAGRPTRESAISVDLLIRPLAVLLVVVHHATHWPIPGGAAAMTLLVGYSLARFQSDAIARGAPARLLSGLPWVLGPYLAILIGYSIKWGEVPWASVFLVGNLIGAEPWRHEMLPHLYWFVEMYALTVLILYAVFQAPAARALATDRPMQFAFLFLAFGFALRYGVGGVWDRGFFQIFTLHWNLYLVAFGWAAAVAKGRREKLLVLAIGLIALPLAAYVGGNWTGSWFKYLTQIGIIALLLYAPVVSAPRWLLPPILGFAAAGYHVFLFHRMAPEHFPQLIGQGVSHELFVAASIVVGLATGFVTYELQKLLLRAASWVRREAGRRYARAS